MHARAATAALYLVKHRAVEQSQRRPDGASWIANSVGDFRGKAQQCARVQQQPARREESKRERAPRERSKRRGEKSEHEEEEEWRTDGGGQNSNGKMR